MPANRPAWPTVLRKTNFPLVGLASATSATFGALAAFSLARLPSALLSAAVLLLAILLLLRGSFFRPFGALLFGLAWTCLHGGWAMQQRLPIELEGVDLRVEGIVANLPQRQVANLRFDFDVVRATGPAEVLQGRRLRLGWYRSAADLPPGSRWQLDVRLKRPRGGVNPGGFDFERHALERRLAATGYVREGPENRQISAGGGIDATRLRVSDAIADAVGGRRGRFVQALAVGDTRALDEHDWEVLRATGIAHLIAISGLHVGLVAGLGALLMRAAHRTMPRIGLRLPLPQSAAAAALVAAAGYTALAGFALPTVRTLLMIAAVLLAVVLRRPVAGRQAFALTACAVLLFDPLSLLGAGFWLSFLGVAWLLWCLPRESPQAAWRALISAQGVMTLSLLPLTVWFFGQASLVGPFANLLAVPWVSFVVVPLTLVGTAAALCAPALGAPFFIAAAWLMEWLWLGLETAAAWRGSIAYLPEASTLALAFSLLGAGWLLLPRGVPGKPLAALLFLPLLLPARDGLREGEVDVTMFDVGQGLSILLRTRDHALLYDAGPAFEGGLDQGEATVVPALRALGVDRLDVYVESHGHNDHAGGSDAVLRAFAPPQVFAADPQRAADRCIAGTHWRWNGVSFALLHPPPDFPYLDNDSSCVLRVATGASAILIPGDISSTIEARLLRLAWHDLRSTVLVMPHHGSRTSSSREFIERVDPELALIGVGHRNRFGLPREDVLARYTGAGVAVSQTADGGALGLRLGPNGATPVRALRRSRPRWWREE